MTGEFVILGRSALVKGWTQLFSANNYERDYQFRLTINI